MERSISCFYHVPSGQLLHHRSLLYGHGALPHSWQTRTRISSTSVGGRLSRRKLSASGPCVQPWALSVELCRPGMLARN